MDPGDVTVCVATFGLRTWLDTAMSVAIPSAYATGATVAYCHGASIWQARNACLDQVATEWVAYLDADDEFESGYLDEVGDGSGADVLVPSMRRVQASGGSGDPFMPQVAGHTHVCTPDCLIAGNWIVIGAVTRTRLLRDVGGWRDFGWEDWDVWLRVHLAGAAIVSRPGAVYRAIRHHDSRGGYSAAESLFHHRAVAAANGVPSP